MEWHQINLPSRQLYRWGGKVVVEISGSSARFMQHYLFR